MTEPAAPVAPTPDDKDWTWVLTTPCPDCGYVASAVPVDELGARTLAAVGTLREALARPGATVRPSAEVWSALEYGAHVRDVCRLFLIRLRSILEQDGPRFANWDQDETALADRYWAQQPTIVSVELADAAAPIAAAIDAIEPGQRERVGYRSDGATFTADGLSRYFLHDLVHHAHDVQSA